MNSLADKRFELADQSKFNADEVVRPNISYWQDAWRRLKKNKLAMISMAVLMILFIMSLIGPGLSGQNYTTLMPEIKNLPPSNTYWLGTDYLGRDLFSRLWKGLRFSIIVAVVAASLKVIIGCIYGAVMAYLGGFVDDIMMRIVEVLNSIPHLIVTLIILVVLGNGYLPLLFALCITNWTSTARMVRGQILKLRESEYIMASAALGASSARVIVRHLIPNTLSLLILDLATSIPYIIFDETVLSFLGIGLQPPAFSLGTLLSAGQEAMAFYPAHLLYPSLLLCLLVLSFNILGDGLRDALDPQLRD
ncbi:ABC transporter permease [Lacrimispora amygdalina]|uniref:ABC transporter permease n=1 Tax=Lacrimispora amygdalina TaxID=253257 RepID=A0A3E2NF99_9FIRM|nr:ABC transporter permease [Clostridium indicum]RFZ79698.1 ABC transporter permease [Clostridium indicum]